MICPEVSYGLQGKSLREEDVDIIISGEGERPFTAWLLSEIGEKIPEEWQFTREGKTIFSNPMPDLSELPFLYDDLSPFANRMIYYEASRGCPFRCAYCLSGAEGPGTDKKVRELPLARVLQELKSLYLQGTQDMAYYSHYLFQTHIPYFQEALTVNYLLLSIRCNHFEELHSYKRI